MQVALPVRGDAVGGPGHGLVLGVVLRPGQHRAVAHRAVAVVEEPVLAGLEAREDRMPVLAGVERMTRALSIPEMALASLPDGEGLAAD